MSNTVFLIGIMVLCEVFGKELPWWTVVSLVILGWAADIFSVVGKSLAIKFKRKEML